MGRLKEVSRTSPCPICGKPDYCCRSEADNGSGTLVTCKRILDEGDMFGTDGVFYLRVGTSKRGNAVYQSAQERYDYEQRKKNAKEYAAPKRQEPVWIDRVEPLSNDKLNKIFRIMSELLVLEDHHREYLKGEGWTDEMLEKYHVVSFPEKDFVRFRYHKNLNYKNPYRKKLAERLLECLGNPEDGLLGVPGAYIKDGKWTFSGPSGIIFWLPDIDHKIYQARIRMDFRDVEAEILRDEQGREYFLEAGDKYFLSMSGPYRILPDGTKERKTGLPKGKYRPFSSFFADEDEAKNGRIVNVYEKGCATGNRLGFYYNTQRDDMYIAYVIEGEKKGMFANHSLRAPMITLPGVDSWSLLLEGEKGSRPVDILKERGCMIIVVAFDADKVKNKTVLDQEQNTVKALLAEGFILGVAEWPLHYGKGMDDVLASGHKISYVAY